MPAGNTQARKWLITFNNPGKYDIDIDEFMRLLIDLKPDYACCVEEVGDEGTHHMHGFIYSGSPKRFTTIKNVFPAAHIDRAYGSCRENKCYILKEGNNKNVAKNHTQVEGTFREFGILPNEREEKNPDNALIIELIKQQKSTREIIEELPKYAMRARNIEELRAAFLRDNTNAIREVNLIIIAGPINSDKIGIVYSMHEPKEICRITNYRSDKGLNFDNYTGQKVLVFDGFTGQIPIENLLLYLSKYPVTLPARYNDRIAAYDTVYLILACQLDELYHSVRASRTDIWNAFCSRVTNLITIDEDGVVSERSLYE